MEAITGDLMFKENADAIPAAAEYGSHRIIDADEQLVRGFLATKNPLTFEKLITPHLNWLRRLVFTVFGGDHPDTEDALQEILLALVTDLPQFRFQSRFKTFFYRFARNKAIDLLRRLRRTRGHETILFPFAHESGGRTPEAEYLRKETSLEIMDALFRLAEADRSLILMKDVEEFSIEEIAAITGGNPGTLKSRLHRIRLKLFRILGRRLS
jgi:RNA polymerase sigma factor (sigma-70 family)